MRKLARFLLLRPILWAVSAFSSDPDRERIFDALGKLLKKVRDDSGAKGFVIPFDPLVNRFIIFSDQHKGAKNGADDFMLAEKNYIAALKYYNDNKYHLIALGDCEELWENTILQVLKHNTASFDAERKFVERNAFTKIFGNHDLDWEIDPIAAGMLKQLYGKQISALEAITLETSIEDNKLSIFCTHGHQGDEQSDGNWFSKFFVSKIWAPLQSYVRINPNTPANDVALKTLHNSIMYEWSSTQTNLILITGHTHQPVFRSLTQAERLQLKRRETLAQQNPEWAEALSDQLSWSNASAAAQISAFEKTRPSYFNSGCCCYEDGDITGLEIADGFIRLIKWEQIDATPSRKLLDEASLADIAKSLVKTSRTG